jgi:5-methylcytosine-specific restriction endonuclease McrA
MKQIKHNLWQKGRIGEKSNAWKGGFPKCLDCGKRLHNRYAKYCKEHACLGERSKLWKGGVSKDKKYNLLRNREWVNENREKKNFLNLKRMAIKKGSEGFHTFEEWELLKRKYHYTCPACGEKEPNIILTQDHIIPLSKGGPDYIENIQPLCGSCNAKKHVNIIDYRERSVIFL